MITHDYEAIRKMEQKLQSGIVSGPMSSAEMAWIEQTKLLGQPRGRKVGSKNEPKIDNKGLALHLIEANLEVLMINIDNIDDLPSLKAVLAGNIRLIRSHLEVLKGTK